MNNKKETNQDQRKKRRWIALLLKLLQLLSQWLQTAKTALGGTTSKRPMGVIDPTKTSPTATSKTSPTATSKTSPYDQKSVSAPASVTFGPRSFEPLSRSQLLSLLRSECRLSPRKIDLLVLHCSDTKPSQSFTIEKLIACHKARGFGPWPGYHLYVRRDGTLYYCRPVAQKGCHVAGYNQHSLGICYEGGHSDSPEYNYEDNRTAEQLVVLDEVLRLLLECFPEAKLVGHNELAAKACPCFDVQREYGYLRPPSYPPKGGGLDHSNPQHYS